MGAALMFVVSAASFSRGKQLESHSRDWIAVVPAWVVTLYASSSEFASRRLALLAN